MAQLSRPFQIAVLAFAMLALAAFFALHRPGSSSSGSSSSASSGSSSVGSGSDGSSSAAGSSSVYHGSAPGVEGLTRDINRAHGAVADAQHNAQEVQSKAAQTPGQAVGAGATGAAGLHGGSAAAGSHGGSAASTAHPAAHPAGAASPKSRGAATSHSKTAGHHSTAATQPSASATASLILHNLTAAIHLSIVLSLVEVLDPSLKAKTKFAHAEGTFIARMKSDLRPASQSAIAGELHHGKTVLLLFLNPHSYDDDATAIETVEAAYKLRHSVTAHLELSSQVNSFDSITRDIQIYQTPTLLVINPKRQVTTLTGLTDEFALEQAISEAKG